MKQVKGPEFIRFFKPILQLLLESGGSGTPAEIVDRSIELAGVSESEPRGCKQERTIANQESGPLGTPVPRVGWLLGFVEKRYLDPHRQWQVHRHLDTQPTRTVQKCSKTTLSRQSTKED